nr:MAG TPA: putative Sin3 binding protein [Caudoviricetes sp.]
MYEFLAYRVITGHLTCIPEKATKTKRLIPEKLRPQVLEILKESGFDGDGQPIERENEYEKQE